MLIMTAMMLAGEWYLITWWWWYWWATNTMMSCLKVKGQGWCSRRRYDHDPPQERNRNHCPKRWIVVFLVSLVYDTPTPWRNGCCGWICLVRERWKSGKANATCFAVVPVMCWFPGRSRWRTTNLNDVSLVRHTSYTFRDGCESFWTAFVPVLPHLSTVKSRMIRLLQFAALLTTS